jgi:hypothetical protein
MSEEEFGDSVNTDFATVVADGAYAHFLDGFISLLFYQIRTYPVENSLKDLKINRKKEIIADIRISTNQLKKLVYDLDSGLALKSTMTLSNSKSGYITRSAQINSEFVGEQFWKSGTFSDAEMQNIQNNLLSKNFEKLSENGKEKYMAILFEAFLERSDEIRELVDKDLEEQSVKKNEPPKSK